MCSSDLKAVEWYENAASLGDTSAMLSLGRMFESGDGKDLNKSFMWYKKALDCGEALAELILSKKKFKNVLNGKTD